MNIKLDEDEDVGVDVGVGVDVERSLFPVPCAS